MSGAKIDISDVREEDISIDKEGRLVINNKDIAKKVAEASDFDDTVAVTNNCNCSKPTKTV
ncbi:hypothetical protein ACVS2C_003552 [Vibrio parahaemolyticus]|nr:hypothetical protein [Vibrio parahaemolyticus]EGR1382681.1 hypothetical protein [Vibrio parahaemolyticus]EJS4021046.1 hypothetical protein [Vibrio parahaemolyticus]ELA7500306.1 hypothetical protein [Vibrio parahaemolyticus]ELA7675171.1 hypothetical protein [Vibrio parahaemolyticus]